MSVRFYCPACRQLLGIAKRKAGCIVQCVKCQASIIVPAADSDLQTAVFASLGAVATAGGGIATGVSGGLLRESDVLPAGSNLLSFDDYEALPGIPGEALPGLPGEALPGISADASPGLPGEALPGAADHGSSGSFGGALPESPGVDSTDTSGAARSNASALAVERAAAVPADQASALLPNERGSETARSQDLQSAAPSQSAASGTPGRFDPRYVAVSRRVLYFHAALIVTVTLVAFALGYYGGRGARAPELAGPAAAPVDVPGRVLYRAEGNPAAIDDQAVVILFPRGLQPSEPIGIQGLRPEDPPPDVANANLRAIEASDGIYRRADAEGRFLVRAPAGTYLLLVISRHARRPEHIEIRPNDLLTLGGYFQSPGELIGPFEYEYIERRLPGEGPLDFKFDR